MRDIEPHKRTRRREKMEWFWLTGIDGCWVPEPVLPFEKADHGPKTVKPQAAVANPVVKSSIRNQPRCGRFFR